MRCSVSLFQSLQNFVLQFDHHCTQASDESDDLGEGSHDKQPEALWRAQRPEMETNQPSQSIPHRYNFVRDCYRKMFIIIINLLYPFRNHW